MSDAIEFRVIGELKCDPDHLLLSDEDGRWYDYDISLGTIVTVEPSDFWAVDLADDSRRSFTAPTPPRWFDRSRSIRPQRVPARPFPTRSPSGSMPYLHFTTTIGKRGHA